jgi:hypothetical protein
MFTGDYALLHGGLVIREATQQPAGQEAWEAASQTLLWIVLNWKHQPYKFNTKGLIGKLDCFK